MIRIRIDGMAVPDKNSDGAARLIQWVSMGQSCRISKRPDKRKSMASSDPKDFKFEPKEKFEEEDDLNFTFDDLLKDLNAFTQTLTSSTSAREQSATCVATKCLGGCGFYAPTDVPEAKYCSRCFDPADKEKQERLKKEAAAKAPLYVKVNGSWKLRADLKE